jgi:hypothetical protein
VIAFAFTKVGDWKPRDLVARLGDLPLRDLLRRLEADYLAESILPPAEVAPCFAPLRDAMERTVGEAVSDPKTLETVGHLRDSLVGDTSLSSYFSGGDPAADVSHWWYAVWRRVVKLLARKAREGGADEPIARLVRGYEQDRAEQVRRLAARKAARLRPVPPEP